MKITNQLEQNQRAHALLAQLENRPEGSGADVPSFYEVNVARMTRGGNYEHLFATHERSGTRSNIGYVLLEILDRFPEPQFSVTVSARVEYGRTIEVKR